MWPLFFAFLTVFLLLGCEKEQKVQPQAPIVEVVEVVQKDVPIYGEWVASLDGLVNATIRAQVQGYLIKQNYTEGDFVRKGQVLFEIDPREYQAALSQAKAMLSQSNGALDQSKAALAQSKGALEQTRAALEKAKSEVAVQEARWTTAKANLARIRPLAQQNAVSQKDLDDAIGTELSTRSSVEAAKAAVDAAQADIVAAQAKVVGSEANIAAAEAQVLASKANVEKAELNLGFSKIVSPVDGFAGIAKAQIGNLVGPGSVEELTTVSTINPIKCYASLSEKEYIQAMEKGAREVGKAVLTLILSDGTTYPYKGEIAFADRQVDVRTGTIRVASLFPNPKNLLRPGMFSRIRAEMGVRKNAPLIPQRAVTEIQGRYLVAVVNPENKVSIKPVKVGERFGELWVVEGLQVGEKVVAEGTQKVRQDMVVNPKPFVREAPAEPGAAQKPEVKPEAKPEAKPQSKPEKR
jgi:membrane fusion protein (multidrug efflux system)